MAYTEDEFRSQLQARGGGMYDDSDLEDARRRGFSDDAMRIADKKYDARANNEPNHPENDNNDGRSNPWSGGNASATQPREAALQQVSQTYSGQGAPVAATAATPFTSGIRDILMSQLSEAQKPVSANDPGIRDVLAGERIQSQRGAERMQSAAAEKLAANGLRESGAADTDRLGILQHQGEQDAQFTGQVLGGELNQRRGQLSNLLQMALASGDTESARELTRALAQMDQSYKYDALRQNQGQFEDGLGLSYNQLNAGSNLSALMSILGAA